MNNFQRDIPPLYHISESTWRFISVLRAELQWLRDNYPQRTALIELAEGRLREFDQLTRHSLVTYTSNPQETK